MATPLSLPYPPLVFVQTDGPLTWNDLHPDIADRLDTGVSILVLHETGHELRGGYFFHFQRTRDGYVFRTFDRQSVLTLRNGDECAAFINHVSGRMYDVEMWKQAQNVNFRTDDD